MRCYTYRGKEKGGLAPSLTGPLEVTSGLFCLVQLPINHIPMTKKRRIDKFSWSKWKVAICLFPYPEGYGVYKENWITGEKVILDTGILKELAEQIANDLNNGRTTNIVRNG